MSGADAFGVNREAISKEWVWTPTVTGDPYVLATDTAIQVGRNVWNNYTGKKTTLEQRQATMRRKKASWVRAQHNAYGGVDIANLADRAAKERRKEFQHTQPGLFGSKTKKYVQVAPKTYRQKGVNARRFKEIDAVYADRKNLPKGKVIVYQEGRKGLIFPGKLSAQAHHADDTAKAGAVSFNTKPVWFDHKTKGRVKWERFAAHHEVGHLGDQKETGRQMMDRQINDMTNRKGRRPHIVPKRLFANTAHEEGMADRHALLMGQGLGRKGNKGGYEKVSAQHKHSPHYWAGRNDEARDASWTVKKDAFGVAKSMTDGDIAAELAWQKKNSLINTKLLKVRKPRSQWKSLTPKEQAVARASLTKPEGQNFPL